MRQLEWVLSDGGGGVVEEGRQVGGDGGMEGGETEE